MIEFEGKEIREFRDFKDFKDFKGNFPSKPLGALQSKAIKGACLTLFIVGQAIFLLQGACGAKYDGEMGYEVCIYRQRSDFAV